MDLSVRHLGLMAFGLIASLQSGVAAPLACHALEGVKSNAGGQKVSMRIVNASAVPADIAWINFESEQKSLFRLKPGADAKVSTFAGHPWIAISTKGECMCGHITEQRADGKDEWTIEAFEPTRDYNKRDMGGFPVYISSRFADNPALRDSATAHLEQMLRNTTAILPESAAKKLHATTNVWLERSDCARTGVEYHAAKAVDWLIPNGKNPDKEKGVQFTADALWLSRDQPAMALHELAHAFHDRFLRYDNPDVLKAFADACRGRKYKSVSDVGGQKAEAYALKNQKEFFAELSEAYFWRNDFEPFDREGLAKFDPESFAVIERLWNTPVGVPNNEDTGGRLTCKRAEELTEPAADRAGAQN